MHLSAFAITCVQEDGTPCPVTSQPIGDRLCQFTLPGNEKWCYELLFEVAGGQVYLTSGASSGMTQAFHFCKQEANQISQRIRNAVQNAQYQQAKKTNMNPGPVDPYSIGIIKDMQSYTFQLCRAWLAKWCRQGFWNYAAGAFAGA